MSFKKYLLEKEEEETSNELESVNQKVIDYFKNIDRDEISDLDIHKIAEDLDMEPSELEVIIYQMLYDKIQEEENEEPEESEESEKLEDDNEELEPLEDEKPKTESKACKVKKDVMLDDSEVIKSFYKKEPNSGNRLKSTGNELKHVAENVTTIAKWEGQKFVVLESFFNVEISKITKQLKQNCSCKK